MVCFFMLHCITVTHHSFWQSLLHLFVKWQYYLVPFAVTGWLDVEAVSLLLETDAYVDVARISRIVDGPDMVFAYNGLSKICILSFELGRL
jgi:hypothetical protein